MRKDQCALLACQCRTGSGPCALLKTCWSNLLLYDTQLKLQPSRAFAPVIDKNLRRCEVTEPLLSQAELSTFYVKGSWAARVAAGCQIFQQHSCWAFGRACERTR